MILATMNPASIGGGRTRLPRSIQGLFTSVMLDAHTDEDLEEIFVAELRVHGLLPWSADTTEWFVMSEENKTKVLDIHKAVCRLVDVERSIGRGGGPFEFNLRDLSKLSHLLRGNAANLQAHFRYSKGISSSDRGPRTLALNKFMNLVYTSRFQTLNDQETVRKLIDSKLSVDERLKRTNATIDTSVAGMLRIGTIYMKISDSDAGPKSADIVHSPKTIRTLEALAAAVQSEPPRAVLLEGDCSSGAPSHLTMRHVGKFLQAVQNLSPAKSAHTFPPIGNR